MIGVLLIVLVGAVTVVLQCALAAQVPRVFVPDLAPLFALSLALHVGGARGLAAATAIGGVADALSVGPTGQAVLVQGLAFAVSRIAHRSLELRTPVAEAALAAIASPIGALVCALMAPIGGHALPLDLGVALQIGAQVVFAAICMPTIGRAVALIARLGGESPVLSRATASASGRRVG